MGDREDSDEYALFFTASWPHLLRVTYAVTGDIQRAEDALQAAFAQAFAAWGKVSRADNPAAYVRKIALNAALAQERKAYRRRETVSDSLHEPESNRSRDDDVVALRDEVWTAVRSLPARQRAVVVLRYYEDLTERQIAEVLDCRPGTVKSQAAAALSTLRTLLHEPATKETTP